jgi:hypothetical protein
VAVGVDVDNFVRAETDRMFAALQADAGGVNVFRHNREPTSIEDQTVIRMNRDTLYSFAIADISEGAVVTVPESGDRYLSVMVVNQDHYINRLFHDPGEYDLTVAEFDTPWVLVAVRVLVDPVDPADIAGVTAIQDEIRFAANASTHSRCRTMSRRALTQPVRRCSTWPSTSVDLTTPSARERRSTRCGI